MGTISRGLLYASIFLSGYISGCLSCARVENYHTSFSRNKEGIEYSDEKFSDMEKRLNKLEKKLGEGVRDDRE